MIALNNMSYGQQGVIRSIAGNDNIAQRLSEIGLLEGESIEVIAIAPLGDPLEIRTSMGCVSLRRAEAARIEVELVPSTPGSASS